MLDDAVVELATAPNFAALSTMMPDGHVQTQMMWVDTDGEYVFVNTEVDRQKFRNIQRNPVVTVLIFDKDNFWRWAEVRGRVVETITGPEARGHIDKMAKKYLGVDDYPNPIASERVLVKIAPERVVVK
jgi:PPOX class probable F420-dependent enzyme